MDKSQLKNMAVDMIVSGVCPMLAYHYLKNQLGWSELHALSAAIIFPIIGAMYDLLKVRTLNIISGLAIVGILVSLLATYLGGDPRLLLIRESLLTLALGIAAFLSLLLPHPLIYYFGRAATARQGTEKLDEFDRHYREKPAVRRLLRFITMVWGVTFTLEFAVKVALVYTLPVETVLIVSPILLNGIIVGTLIFTFAYVRIVRKRAQAQAQGL